MLPTRCVDVSYQEPACLLIHRFDIRLIERNAKIVIGIERSGPIAGRQRLYIWREIRGCAARGDSELFCYDAVVGPRCIKSFGALGVDIKFDAVARVGLVDEMRPEAIVIGFRFVDGERTEDMQPPEP